MKVESVVVVVVWAVAANALHGATSV